MNNNERKPLTLTAENVTYAFIDCLLGEEEIEKGRPTCDHVIAQGIRREIHFNSERLSEHAADISNMVDQLFGEENILSFLKLCNDSTGILWGEHENVDQLVTLAVANGDLAYLLNKEDWGVLPGSMPVLFRIPKEPIKIGPKK